MGGGIAALTAARYPAQVDRVGLFDAAGVRFKDNQFGIDVPTWQGIVGPTQSAKPTSPVRRPW